MRVLGALALSVLVAVGLVSAPTAASADPTWAPAASAAIHPGTMMYTAGAQCTANFVYTDDAGNVYVGYAAHCAGEGSSTDTNGCLVDSVPLGTKVDFTNDGNLLSEGTIVGHGTLAYSSWITEHQLGTTDANTCAYNDLALVKVDPADVGKVNPSVPRFGGPTGLGSSAAGLGDTVYSYGNSSLRGGVTTLSPKQGIVVQGEGNGWSRTVYTVTPGIPGDSGSGFMDDQGNAFGVLSTLQLAPIVASNGVSDLRKMLAYARTHGGPDVTLAAGTEPFTGSIIG
jgi:hypothetical protein